MTDDEITAIWNGMPGGHAGFLIDWGYLTFARKLLETAERPAPELQPLKEELRFCVDNGQFGPRTGAALRWAIEAIEAIEVEATS